MLEWTIAFGYTFFLLTFFYDLRMSKGVHKGDLSRNRLLDMQQRGIPISAVTAGHEGDHSIRPSTETGPYTSTTNGVAPPMASHDRGATRHAANGYV